MSSETAPVCRVCGREGHVEAASTSFTAVLALMRAAAEGTACECPACRQTLDPREAGLIVERAMAAADRSGAAPGAEAKLPCPFCQTPVSPVAVKHIESEASQTDALRRLVDTVRAAGAGACPWCESSLNAEQMLASLRRVAPSGPWDRLEASLYGTSTDEMGGESDEALPTPCPFCASRSLSIRQLRGEKAQTEAVQALVARVRARGVGPCPWCDAMLSAHDMIAALKRVAPDGPWEQLEASV